MWEDFTFIHIRHISSHCLIWVWWNRFKCLVAEYSTHYKSISLLGQKQTEGLVNGCRSIDGSKSTIKQHKHSLLGCTEYQCLKSTHPFPPPVEGKDWGFFSLTRCEAFGFKCLSLEWKCLLRHTMKCTVNIESWLQIRIESVRWYHYGKFAVHCEGWTSLRWNARWKWKWLVQQWKWKCLVQQCPSWRWVHCDCWQ